MDKLKTVQLALGPSTAQELQSCTALHSVSQLFAVIRVTEASEMSNKHQVTGRYSTAVFSMSLRGWIGGAAMHAYKVQRGLVRNLVRESGGKWGQECIKWRPTPLLPQTTVFINLPTHLRIYLPICRTTPWSPFQRLIPSSQTCFKA